VNTTTPVAVGVRRERVRKRRGSVRAGAPRSMLSERGPGVPACARPLAFFRGPRSSAL
jgi:hypothetical protein